MMYNLQKANFTSSRRQTEESCTIHEFNTVPLLGNYFTKSLKQLLIVFHKKNVPNLQPNKMFQVLVPTIFNVLLG